MSFWRCDVSSPEHRQPSTDACHEETNIVDWTLELIVVPVSDIDRAKAFYSGKMGFHVDVDHSAGEDFRVVQLTPPGSACSVTLMRTPDMAPGTLHGLHIVVPDIDAARAELVSRGTEVGELFHFGPPAPMLFEGLDVIGPLLANALRDGEWRLLPTMANRMPTAASYLRQPGDTIFRAFKFDVLRIRDGKIAEITTFGSSLFPQFGLPPTL
jgi:predicted enzyme related to lactoylglutathione lyase